MPCVSIRNCECIRRISVLLNKYQTYQQILHPHGFINSDKNKSYDSNTYNDADTPDSDTYDVEYVQNIDYNHDLIQYDAENIDPNEHAYHTEQDEDEEEQQDILTYLDKLNITQIINDYNHIIIDHYNSDFESIYNLITNKYSYFTCDINECGAFFRTNRCRETVNVLHNEFEFKTHNFVSIDLLDSIHCHLIHLFDIGFRIKSSDLYNDNIIENDEKSQHINLDKLRKITSPKQQRIIETRGYNRIHVNKFKTDTNKKQANGKKLYKAVSIGLDEEEIKEINDNNIAAKDEKENMSQNVHRFGYKTPHSNAVTPKYSDLKTEILNNNIFAFGIDIYNEIVLKAEYKLQCDMALHLRSCSDESDIDTLLVENIIVLLLYIDYDIFRNKYFNLIKCRMNKLTEFYNFHFGLQNTVNLYGTNVSARHNKHNNLYNHSKMQRFYHYHSTMVAFEGIKCEFLNVISMCGNIAPVALYNINNNIENDAGMILEFAPFELECKYFMCAWLSSVGGEDERLFMDKSGGLQLTNILINEININDSYRLFLEALSCFDDSLCEGWKSANTTKQHYKIINKLIEKKENSDNSYKRQIFSAFCLNKLRIEIKLVQNLRGPFCELLFKSTTNNYNATYRSVCGALIRFDFLCGLFSNCEVIKTWYVGNNDYNQHSGINEKWIDGLYLMLNGINDEHESKLNKIIINNNHQKVEPIIGETQIENLFEQKFFEKGWKIQYNDYSKKMNQIIVTKIIIWNRIKIISFNVQNGYYWINIKSDNFDKDIVMKYIEIREVFEEIDKKLSTISAEKLSEMKELKKIFPSQSILKKNKNEKLMKHRQSKLNQYFETLIQFANKNKQDINDKMSIKMNIMTTLTGYFIK